MLTNSLKDITQSIDSKWIHTGKNLNIKHVLDIQSHLSKILEDIFYHSPILKNELINRDNISAQGQSARTNLIKMMGKKRIGCILVLVMIKISFLQIKQFLMQSLIS